ncbi:KpsF/GutQ family sugar-phosphate isomerase [Sphingobium nicotianae]|uniref:KpsF/GutQ family sugar-phosphate isomerase n=1 Tax=Sphingobium nicotianae TaxID=2782607 RepID=A0A9X1DEQ3_9SPHN|nr:KpsF/GutQ family sugar-phosphate isomerase [Sphingobium nicotianae]MBT2188573.1 KpsF/GutQ family sugar-phosphate isomerase [Sphingobium nicotianae]
MFYDIKQRLALRSNLTAEQMLAHGRSVLAIEASALTQLGDQLDESFPQAIELLLATSGRVIVSGMGKSGHVARKMAATFSSTGLPAFFVHPGEAAHGDLGMITPGDVLVALSNSGATSELQPIMRHARLLDCPVIGITSQRGSPMGQIATVCLTLPRVREACPANISPTTTTTLMLALGDALAVTVMHAHGISRTQLELLHPGGSIGSRLLPVDKMMHEGAELPLVSADAPMQDVLVIMTEKSFGIAGVIDAAGRLIGTITDGDLRRKIDGLLARSAGDVMTASPKTIPGGTYAEDAFAIMTINRITALFVMDADAPERPIGLLHIHDLNRLGMTPAQQ